MMTIDLTDLLASLAPDPITLTIEGKAFSIESLSVATVLLLGKKANESNEELAKFLKQVFGDAVPPSIDQLLANYAEGDEAATLAARHRLMREVQLIYGTLMLAIREVGSQKKLDAALETMLQRVTGTALPTSDTSAA